MSQTRGRPFQPGNKFGRGRPAGSRNKATIALQELLDDHGEALVTKAKVLALQGDIAALKLCLDRIVPPLRNNPVRFKLPKISGAPDVGMALETVLQAIASGKLTPQEGETISRVLEARRKSIESEDLAARVLALEKRDKDKPT